MVRFLGLQLDEGVASDIKYAVEMLSSKDSKIFFCGLKILAAIHESNEDSEKRSLADRLLAMLCKVIPSYVKRGTEFYDLNKTKIEESIKSGKHPLDLKNTIALAKRGTLPAGETGEEPTGFVIRAITAPAGVMAPTTTSRMNEKVDDDIKVISIEDATTGEEELVAMAKHDAAEEISLEEDGMHESIPVSTPASIANEPEEDASATNASLDFTGPELGSFNDDEWVRAGSLTDIADGKLLFDKDGKVDKDFRAGLTLINPVEREQAIDLNYSAAKGYHDPYRGQAAPAGLPAEMPADLPSGVPDDLLPDSTAQEQVQPIPDAHPPADVPVPQVVTPVEGGPLAGQQCGLGDGDISASDAAVYVCPGCKTPFHEGCGKLVLEVEGGKCPACNATWQ